MDLAWTALAHVACQACEASERDRLGSETILCFRRGSIDNACRSYSKKPSSYCWVGHISVKMPFATGVVSRDLDFEGLPIRFSSRNLAETN